MAQARDNPIGTLDVLIDGLARHGDRPALLSFRHGRALPLCYGDLALRIERAARWLKSRGIGRGQAVAIFAPNRPEWVVAWLAIVRAGAYAVPIDAQQPPESAVALLDHARPALLLTTTAGAAALATLRPAIEIVAFDAADDWPPPCADPRDIGVPAAAGEVAALFFTSGTTGTPKGVPLTHGNIAGNATALLEARLIGSRDRVLLPLPLHHTYALTVGMLTPLATGAMVILPAGISGPELAAAAVEGRATTLLAVPRLCEALWDGVAAGVAARGHNAERLFGALLDASVAVRRATGLRIGRWLFRGVQARLGGRLRLIGCGGARLAPALAWRLEGLGWRVLTGYGLTETSPLVTFNSLRHARIGSEGRPLRGVEISIDAAVGTRQGEILVRGPGVFPGYWHDAAATAAAFTADGRFRTGDLGWIDPQGYLHVEGRSKELIVLADGKKMFPEDVERLYGAAELIGEIALLERNGRLAALIVPNEDAFRRRGALRETALLRESLEDVAARLPPYQRIVEYRVTRLALPRTQLGKLKRHLLPALFEQAARGVHAAPAPLTGADRRLLEGERARAVLAWLASRYPGRPLTLETSPQLDLEIDSLAWVALTLEIEQRFGVTLDSAAVSRIVTLRDLLNEIGSAAPATAPRAASPGFVRPGPVMRGVGAIVHAVVRIGMRLVYGVRVAGAANVAGTEPLVIAPNHASYLDPLALTAALPWARLRRTYWAGWVGVLYTGRFRRFVSRAAQVIPLDPDRALAAALDTARELLRQGYSIVWFPEGRRSPTGELGPFHHGIGLLLGDGGARAVPAAIEGSFEAWPRHRRWPKGGSLKVTFGAPLRAADTSSASAELENAVRALLDNVHTERRERA